MTFELIENERRVKDESHPFTEERRKPVNIVNEANRIALAGSCTCAECYNDAPPMSDFAKALVIRNAAVMLDNLNAGFPATTSFLLEDIGIELPMIKQMIEQLHTIAEELAGSRVLELYGRAE